MALNPTVREVDFIKSIKKYFLDNLETTSSIKVFFEELLETPQVASTGVKYTEWVIITFGTRNLGPVSEQRLVLNLYTRNDKEGDNLAALEDLVMNYLLDEGSTNGLKTIPYYDTSVPAAWTIVGGILPFLQMSLGKMENEDAIQFKSINLLCKWGGK